MTKNLKFALLAATTLAMTPAAFASNDQQQQPSGAQQQHQDPAASSEVFTLAQIREAAATEESKRSDAHKKAIEFAEIKAAELSSKGKIAKGFEIDGLEAVDGLLEGFIAMLVEAGHLDADTVDIPVDEDGNPEDLASQVAGYMSEFSTRQLTAVSAEDHSKAIAEATQKAKEGMHTAQELSEAKATAFDQGKAAAQIEADQKEARDRLAAAFVDLTVAEVATLLAEVKKADTEDKLGLKDIDLSDNDAVTNFLAADAGKAHHAVIAFAVKSDVKAIIDAVAAVKAPATAPATSEADAHTFKKLAAALKAMKATAKSGKVSESTIAGALKLIADEHKN